MSGGRGGCVPLTDAQRDEAEKYLKLCGYAADRFARRYRGIGRDEYLSAAFEGLADAVKGFDPARGVTLEYYAPRRIEGACLDLMRAEDGGVVRRTRWGRAVAAAGAGYRVLSLDGEAASPGRAEALLPPDPAPPPGAALADREGFERLLVGLRAVETFVVRKVYGPEDWSFDRVGAHLELSPSRIGQIHRAALAKVARRATRLGLGAVPVVADRPRRAAAGSAPRDPVRHGRAEAAIDPATGAAFLLASVRRNLKPPAWRDALAADAPRAGSADRAALDRMLAALEPDRRRVLEARYGLDGALRPLGEVARLLGWTIQRVHYAQQLALKSLREIHETETGPGGTGP